MGEVEDLMALDKAQADVEALAAEALAAQGVMPQPTPFTVRVGKTEVPGADGQPLIVIEIHKVTGMEVLFCPPDFAKQVAAMLNEAATGITVPVQGSGLVVPGR